MKIPESKSVVIPSGTYRAICREVRELPKQFQNDPPVDGVKFFYDVYLPNGETVELSRHISNSLGTKSHLRTDLIAIHGEKALMEALELGEEAYTALVMGTAGKEMLLITELRTSLTGNDYTNITSVAGLPSGAKTQTPTSSKVRVMPGGKAPAPKSVWAYDVSKVAAEKREDVERYLQVTGAKPGPNGVWVSNKEVKKLARIEVPLATADDLGFVTEDEDPNIFV